MLPSGEDFTGKVPNAVERIDLWKLHNVTDMKDTFNNKSFENKDASNITGWDVSNVTTMEVCFKIALDLIKTFLIGTSNVTTMKNMFVGATSFNQYINDWSVNNVTTMEGMFAGATSFDQSLNKWVLSEKLIDASGMFMGASSLIKIYQIGFLEVLK